MRTNQIEMAANRGDLATADFPIQLALRQAVIPAFLEDCGRIGWRTKVYSFATAAGVQSYPLPADFFEADEVYLPLPQCRNNTLTYIGEDSARVAAGEAQVQYDSEVGIYGYYLRPDATTPGVTDLKLNLPATGIQTMYLAYYWYLPFSADEDIDLRPYFPEQYHWALVELLRREIIADRFGQGDQRYATADAKYKEWLNRISMKRELGPRGNKATYMN